MYLQQNELFVYITINNFAIPNPRTERKFGQIWKLDFDLDCT